MASFRVMGEVGKCGEDLIAALLGGKVVSGDYESEFPMDVLVEGQKLGVEVKMCNRTHDQRATVAQVQRLHEGIKTEGFLLNVRRGLYALVFYDAVGQSKGDGRRKSKIMSRKIKPERRRLIIARELQYIYLLDAEMMMHLATHPAFKGLQKTMEKTMICDATKEYRREYTSLHLTRTFLKGFIGGKKMREDRHNTMDQVYQPGRWAVSERKVSICFTRSRGPSLVREVPIRLIGSKKLDRVVGHILGRKKEMRMSLRVPPRARA